MRRFNRLPLLLALLLHASSARSQPWPAPSGLVQTPIWPHAAPNSGPAIPPESVTHQNSHGGWTQVSNVSQPGITVFPPTAPSTGAAIVVFPGGGFKVLAIDLEGTEICDWLTARGITCVLLKYRVPGGNHHWDETCQCHITPAIPRALQDAQRAIRLVRARASELKLDGAKIGVIGFSAGGYLVAQTSNIVTSTYRRVDAADQFSSRPDFAIALYPGHLCRANGKFDASLPVSQRTPPTFLLHAWDDPVDPVCNTVLYAQALAHAGVPSEVHLYAQGGHAFGLRAQAKPIAAWPMLVENWLKEIGIL